jgi:branched-chain amino acid transport system substrate-binding protein
VFRMILKGTVAISAVLATSASLAQTPIRIGEINSYKALPAFLEPYKKGMELAVDQVNAKGGVIGRPLELITRDDSATPGDAVRVAQALVTRDRVDVLAGTFLSHIGLAVSDFARQRKVFFWRANRSPTNWCGAKATNIPSGFGRRPTCRWRCSCLKPWR